MAVLVSSRTLYTFVTLLDSLDAFDSCIVPCSSSSPCAMLQCPSILQSLHLLVPSPTIIKSKPETVCVCVCVCVVQVHVHVYIHWQPPVCQCTVAKLIILVFRKGNLSPVAYAGYFEAIVECYFKWQGCLECGRLCTNFGALFSISCQIKGQLFL